MARITKQLPPDRADYTFGDLVYWHLFKFGTRPNVDPLAKIGRLWDIDEVRGPLGITQRTLRNWIADKNLPDSITSLDIVLFGENPAWNDSRRELQQKFERSWMAKRSKGQQAEPADVAAAAEDPVASHASATSEPPSSKPDDTPATSPTADEKPAEKSGKAQEKPRPFRPMQPVPPVKLHRKTTPLHPATRRAFFVLVVIAAGTFAWIQFGRKPETSGPAPQSTASQTPPAKTKPPATETGETKVARSELGAPVAIPPPNEQQAAPAAPPVLTEEEKKKTAQRQFAEKLAAAREAAYDRELREREEQARRLDAQNGVVHDQQNELEADARAVAKIGYRLRENTSVEGSSYRNLLTETTADCAFACAAENCDAFAYYRDQSSSTARRKRYCYLYQKPFITGNHQGYAFGERVADPVVGGYQEVAALSPADDGRVRVAQAAPSTATGAADDLVRCSGGPVKVTGFKVKCDWILSGGTTLGSARLSYTVANVNECAAKCKAVSKCVAFTFNSGDPEGQHACQIFGPTPEGRESKGWVSGAR
jgi:hypothetical protein